MVDESKRALEWIAGTLGPETAVSLMSQYVPIYRACRFPEIDRRVSPKEYDAVCEHAIRLGFENGWFQEEGAASEERVPVFDLRGL
jgi:putative pyruvate formate lyase activating enzyme